MTTTVQPLDQASARLPTPDGSRQSAVAGVLLFLGGASVLMGIITAEALYPARYNTHSQSVSDLAAMRPDNLVRQPSALIFNLTMILAGLAIAVAAYLLHRAHNARRITLPVALLGLGMIGVGFFPGNFLAPHTLFSMIAFTAGGIGAITTAKLHTGALRLLHTGLGIVSLSSLVIGGVFFVDWAPVARLGEGGVERWVVYPVVLWIVTLGAALAATRTTPDPVERGAGDNSASRRRR